MKLWVSSETAGVSAIDDRNLSKSYIQIEEDLNNYLKSISYSNEKLTRVRLILIIRNDDFSALGGEYIRKQPKEPIMNCHLRIDYNEFKNGNEQTRKLLIYQAIFTTFDMIAKKKKIKNLEVVKEYINKKIEELNK
jgi:cell division protein ZapA (FtsZ GTPase activity inhibitor)